MRWLDDVDWLLLFIVLLLILLAVSIYLLLSV